MPIYLSSEEKALFDKNRSAAPLNYFYWALFRRVNERVAAPGLMNAQTTVEWWHASQEFVTDAAMLYALEGGCDRGRLAARRDAEHRTPAGG